MSLLVNIYNTYFQPPYVVDKFAMNGGSLFYSTEKTRAGERKKQVRGISLFEKYNGREVFLPVAFCKGDRDEEFLKIPCCTVRITSKKMIISTAVSERKGTVKEIFNVGDYMITIKGVLIGANDTFPDGDILKLKELYETTEEVKMNNAMVELLVNGSRKVVIESIEFPEKEGGSMQHRPFVLQCQTDFIDDLIVAENEYKL